MLDLKNLLNDKQYEAAVSVEGPVLILAGAGSGKTRMIIHRMAHMLEKGIPQNSMLALTFTNKAAREMATRVKKLTQRKLTNLTVSTFHSFGVSILRQSIHHLGYRDNFSIYDESDKISLLKECARELSLSPDSLDLYGLSNLFSAVKTGRADLAAADNSTRALYQEYLEHLHLYNAVDFDDLIVLPIRLFTEYPEVLVDYQNRYRYIMVDEFQDTSMAQYRVMKLLGEKHRNVCVVGDDDQSIYSWRGADYHNILNFESDFPELKEIKLEQNYRSTGNILSAANSLIANNQNRKSKELWTGMDSGRTIELFYPDNEQKEAAFIAESIKTIALREDVKYHDVGVLVRTNSLTANIEEAFLAEGIPYKISGGTSFFQRKEIKDIIAYLRIVCNPDDDVNLVRILNTPRRGFGKKTLQIIRQVADEKKCSYFSAISALRFAEDSPFSERVKGELDGFINLFNIYKERFFTGRKMADTLKSLIDEVDYWGYLLQEHQKNDKLARWKFGNLTRFMELLDAWESDPDNLKPNIFAWLNRITLNNRDEDADEENGKVNLMTIHSAKGLEFETVYLAGVEEFIIPHARSLEENPENIEEERRLFYVAITRARQRLYITSCRTRRIMREVVETGPSSFLSEIPEELMVFHEPEKPVDTEEAHDYFAAMKARMGANS